MSPAPVLLQGLLAPIARAVRADAIQLCVDLGTGYWRDCFVEADPGRPLLSDAEPPPFVVLRETRTRRQANPSGLVASAERLEYCVLPVGTAGRRDTPRSGIALLRGPAGAAFNPDERRWLAQLLSPFNAAIKLACELECARQREALALETLARANTGYLLLDAQGMPLAGNALAYELLDAARIQVGSRLRFSDAAEQLRFETALARLVDPARRARQFGWLAGAPPLALTLHVAHAGGAAAALTLRHPRTVACLPRRAAAHFGLTPAEFRLCQALIDGHSLKACAQAWNRSYETLRSQLRAILAKTGTHRQTELVALLDAFLEAD